MVDAEPEAISIYVHVPFCRRKCDYCHFYVIPDAPDRQQALVAALQKEWDYYKPLCQGKRLVSLYFGGGTPILLGASYIAELIAYLTKDIALAPACEITVEANPEEITATLVRSLAAGGVNRLSIGLQAYDDTTLHTLGRLHSGTMAFSAVEIAAGSGIANISADLMYDLPDQTMSLWEATLAQTLLLPLKHLSLYNLTIEPATIFYRQRKTLTPRLPDDATSTAMFILAQQLLPTSGLEQYEISAFAQNGYHSVHNTGYWTNRPFLGLGPSAFSYWQGCRYRNVAHFQRYCQAMAQNQSAVDFSETLPAEEHLRERLAVNLRLLKGIDLTLFPPLPSDLYPTIEELAAQGLLHYQPSHIQLTQRGILFYDTVASSLI